MVTVRDSSGRLQSYQHDDTLINEPRETTRLLAEGARIADETEEIGARTAKEMLYQREMINESGEHINSMKLLASSARKTMNQIQNSVRRQVMILWTIIILLLLANLSVIVTLIQNNGKLIKHE